MTTAERIASWLYRDLATRSSFRDSCDHITPGGQVQLVTYWAARIEEEIGDNRLLKALEKTAADPANAITIAKRALGPAPEEKAIAASVTTLAYDGQAVQLDLPTGVKTMSAIIDAHTDNAVRDAASALVAHRAAPPVDLDDFA